MLKIKIKKQSAKHQSQPVEASHNTENIENNLLNAKVNLSKLSPTHEPARASYQTPLKP